MNLVLKNRLYWAGAFVVSSLAFAIWSINHSLRDAAAPPNQNSVPLTQIQGPLGPAFDLRGLTVPAAEIQSGGPPKDGIPALTNPAMVTGGNATYLRPSDRVIGVFADSQARAYPLRILNYHEIVNDRIGQLPIAVTYCPLCDSAAVFDRRTPLGEREFGVSGLLYNSNVLMYDRGGQSESLWSQVKTQGISGPAADKSLRAVPLELTTWKDWLTRYPNTQVLSEQTGHRRDYGRSPYAGYFTNPQLMFPVQPVSNALPTKTPVLGVWTDDGTARAYPLSAFGNADSTLQDTVGGKNVTIAFHREANRLRVVEADEGLHWMYSLWFAWYAFHPDTSISSSP
ncbi:hypothetical protein Pla52o_22460 [Novipirellula galeiformis]|uniref:DUF3179 domain-containing protein n=1 Tax=Novipirellula galeiformis TaxID=2528004 RepID=A0A5C6CNI7_9BACT|nr:DUF3179 domain-containing protein [Novipirellula galeiformis]TWU24319.1 hypothetical protein Pla52o_22460 [Novipirellula galeiformis]